MAPSHADLDERADEAGHEWSRDDLTIAEKQAELGGGDESSSVAETLENAEGIDPGGPAGVQSTTEVTPAPADETSAPNEVNTENERPPVATSTPDEPIAQVLAAGAGEHTPPDPDEFDAEGRPKPEDA